MKNKEAVDWLGLPDDITCSIFKKLIDVKHYIRFGATCKSWRSVYIDTCSHGLPLRRQLPLLMLSPPEYRNNHGKYDFDSQTRRFYSLENNRVGKFQVSISHDQFCPNSSHGWLVKVSPDHDVSLLNPFMLENNEIQLASLASLGSIRRKLAKVVLSANPASTPNFVAMAIKDCVSRSLAFFRPGDKAWTPIDYEFLIQDIIFFRDRFYALNHAGVVSVWDMNHDHPIMESLKPPCITPKVYNFISWRSYLVESSGNLLIVTRNIKYAENKNIKLFKEMEAYFTCGFCIFKLDEKQSEWTQVNTLQGCALFLGNNSSMSLLASDFAECKPNSIYFTDDNFMEHYYVKSQNEVGPYDMGVFDVQDGTINQHYPREPIMMTTTPPPIWIEPMPTL